jgi:hypothetical protein
MAKIQVSTMLSGIKPKHLARGPLRLDGADKRLERGKCLGLLTQTTAAAVSLQDQVGSINSTQIIRDQLIVVRRLSSAFCQ